jgi:predicted nucleotidyltransferase
MLSSQVDKAILYGSHAKGVDKNGSDIDLTLRGGADLTLNVLYKIMDEHIYNCMGDLDVINHIHRVGITLYDKEEELPELAAR